MTPALTSVEFDFPHAVDPQQELFGADAAVRSALLQFSLCALLASGVATCEVAWGSPSMRPGLYEITSTTVMPHLEENLRYTTTREERCMGEADLPSVFPILAHEALQGCGLDEGDRQEDTLWYRLECDQAQGPSGTAHLLLGPDRITGTLDVKLRGKNMTFAQRVIARRLRECSYPKPHPCHRSTPHPHRSHRHANTS